MKNTLILFLIALSFNNFSQNSKIHFGNFSLQDSKEIHWQKVYEIQASKDSIVKLLSAFKLSSSFLNNLEYNNYTFSGLSNFSKISDLKGLPIAVHTDFNCFISIDIKENKYRVSIKNVKFKPINLDMGMIEMNTNFTLEDIVVRDNHNEIRQNKTAQKVLTNLQNDFIKLLLIKEFKKEDW